MTQRGRIVGSPRDHLTSGTWPTGTIADDAPLGVIYASIITRRLARAMGDMTQSQLGREADVARTTVHDILHGKTWPDLVTLAKLEEVLGVTLWPTARERRELSRVC